MVVRGQLPTRKRCFVSGQFDDPVEGELSQQQQHEQPKKRPSCGGGIDVDEKVRAVPPLESPNPSLLCTGPKMMNEQTVLLHNAREGMPQQLQSPGKANCQQQPPSQQQMIPPMPFLMNQQRIAAPPCQVVTGPNQVSHEQLAAIYGPPTAILVYPISIPMAPPPVKKTKMMEKNWLGRPYVPPEHPSPLVNVKRPFIKPHSVFCNLETQETIVNDHRLPPFDKWMTWTESERKGEWVPQDLKNKWFPLCEHDLQEMDVMRGRGEGTNRYEGNKWFRTLVGKFKDLYKDTPKQYKSNIALYIVKCVRSKHGRFIQKEKMDDREFWFEIGDSNAVDKAKQTLRERSA